MSWINWLLNMFAKERVFIVNGAEAGLKAGSIAYEDLWSLIGQKELRPGMIYTITYRRGHPNKPEGTIAPGERVKLVSGMVFNVATT